MNIIPWETGIIPEAGKCYSGLSNDDYHNTFIEWFSSSDLKNIGRSLEYFWQEYNLKKLRADPKYIEEHGREYKMAFEVGQAYHDACGSLAMFDDLRLFEENTVSFEGKALGKKFEAKKAIYPHKSVIPEEVFENIPIMAEKTISAARKLDIFHGGDIELSFFWIDQETGLKLKCRTDYYRPDAGVIVDFKSTKDHTEKGFPKEIANYNYHFSAAMYLDGVSQVVGEPHKNFLFIATANTPPFEVGFYHLNDASINQGTDAFRQALTDLSFNENPEPAFRKIGVPFWALKKN
ncbi:MAG: hypothetical protein GWP06_02855 [Actinobacteria bacterium]|nr:hypothetical protein [Actinomycetota bacterium]